MCNRSMNIYLLTVHFCGNSSEGEINLPFADLPSLHAETYFFSGVLVVALHFVVLGNHAKPDFVFHLCCLNGAWKCRVALRFFLVCFCAHFVLEMKKEGEKTGCYKLTRD